MARQHPKIKIAGKATIAEIRKTLGITDRHMEIARLAIEETKQRGLAAAKESAPKPTGLRLRSKKIKTLGPKSFTAPQRTAKRVEKVA